MYSKKSETGFSVVEVLVVSVIIGVIALFALVQIGPVVRNARVDTAASNVLNLMRNTREHAIDERRKYQITFVTNATSPYATMNVLQGNVVVTAGGPVLQFAVDPVAPSNTPTISLPFDMHFLAPNPAPGAAPDAQLCGQGAAIEFSVSGGACGSSTVLTFNPDGSITSGLGGFADGVIYLGRPAEPLATRAVSFFGATGRTKGWRMVPNGPGVWKWSTQ